MRPSDSSTKKLKLPAIYIILFLPHDGPLNNNIYCQMKQLLSLKYVSRNSRKTPFSQHCFQTMKTVYSYVKYSQQLCKVIIIPILPYEVEESPITIPPILPYDETEVLLGEVGALEVVIVLDVDIIFKF